MTLATKDAGMKEMVTVVAVERSFQNPVFRIFTADFADFPEPGGKQVNKN
jgi:hypothetical protein